MVWYVCPRAKHLESYNVSGRKSPAAVASTLRSLRAELLWKLRKTGGHVRRKRPTCRETRRENWRETWRESRRDTEGHRRHTEAHTERHMEGLTEGLTEGPTGGCMEEYTEGCTEEHTEGYMESLYLDSSKSGSRKRQKFPITYLFNITIIPLGITTQIAPRNFARTNHTTNTYFGGPEHIDVAS